jgi:hypothetical protein
MLVLAVTLWIFCFASSTFLIMSLTILRIYRSYSSNKKIKEREFNESLSRQQDAIDKWKQKVLRP